MFFVNFPGRNIQEFLISTNHNAKNRQKEAKLDYYKTFCLFNLVLFIFSTLFLVTIQIKFRIAVSFKILHI